MRFRRVFLLPLGGALLRACDGIGTGRRGEQLAANGADLPIPPAVLRRAVGAELRRRGTVQGDREIAPAARAAGILFLP